MEGENCGESPSKIGSDLSGVGPVPVRPGSVSTGIDPMRRGLGGPSKSSESAAQAVFIGTLQGLTCEKKTESILVKAADLYSTIIDDIIGIET